MDIIIKRFNDLSADELYKILKLRSDVFIIEQTCVYPDCDGNDDKAYHLYVAENNGVIGCLRILERGVTFDSVALGRIAVDENSRNKGIARAMINTAIDFAKNNMGAANIKLAAQAYLKDYYQTFGFYPISDVYIDDGIAHINMEMKIK